jgi:hypothetical protein
MLNEIAQLNVSFSLSITQQVKEAAGHIMALPFE